MTVPRIFCDFNKRVDHATYSLDTVGSRRDLELLGGAPAGRAAVFYDEDGFDNGDPAWILAAGVIEEDPQYGWVAHVDPESFRWEPRVGEGPPAA